MKTLLNILFILTILLYISCQNEGKQEENSEKFFQKDRHGLYFGEKMPGDSAVLLAPGFISTPLYTRDITFMPNGKEAYFSVSSNGMNLIFETKMDWNHQWTIPKPASFITNFEYMYYEPFIDQEGKNMYFLSNMTDEDGIKGDEDIWVIERIDDKWSKPRNLGYPINTDAAEFFPSLTTNGTIYFTQNNKEDGKNYIFRARQKNGKFEVPERLPDNVNCGTNRFNAYVSPDEDYIIVPAIGMNKNEGADYYIVFNLGEDTWSEPINAGNQMNTEANGEYSASLSFDKKYIFFMSNRKGKLSKSFDLQDLVLLNNEIINGNSNIYWMSSDFIEKLRPHK